MKKRIIMFCTFIIIVFIIIFKIINNPNFPIFINWKLYLSSPSNEETIYEYDWREGEDFYIWYYRKLKVNKKFTKIDKNNIKAVLEKFENYYDRLDGTEKTLLLKNIYWNFDYEKNPLINNYYFYKEDDDSKDLILIITDLNNNKLYIFQSCY